MSCSKNLKIKDILSELLKHYAQPSNQSPNIYQVNSNNYGVTKFIQNHNIQSITLSIPQYECPGNYFSKLGSKPTINHYCNSMEKENLTLACAPGWSGSCPPCVPSQKGSQMSASVTWSAPGSGEVKRHTFPNDHLT